MPEHRHRGVGQRCWCLDDLGALRQHKCGVGGQHADELFAVGPLFSARANDRLPRKSIFFLDTAQAIPRSCGVTVPSVS